jgi:hypothetical protein
MTNCYKFIHSGYSAFNRGRIKYNYGCRKMKVKVSSITKKDELHKASTPPQLHSGTIENLGGKSNDKVESSLRNSRANRITSSSIAIVWSVLLLVLFTFFNHHIAYYQPEIVDGVTRWIRYPILTESFAMWLPIIVTTLILFVVGYILLIRYDGRLIQATVLICLNLFLLATVVSLLYIFPFDFTAIPIAEMAYVLDIVIRVTLIAVATVLGLGILIKLIKLIVTVFMRRT